jgi:Ca2+-binding EF-hand superfamily protein
MQDFALGLSILVKGSEEDKLRWTFNMYDLNGDGVITRDEMEDVVASVTLIDSTSAVLTLRLLLNTPSEKKFLIYLHNYFSWN